LTDGKNENLIFVALGTEENSAMQRGSLADLTAFIITQADKLTGVPNGGVWILPGSRRPDRRTKAKALRGYEILDAILERLDLVGAC
jgi:hypothetical protein